MERNAQTYFILFYNRMQAKSGEEEFFIFNPIKPIPYKSKTPRHPPAQSSFVSCSGKKGVRANLDICDSNNLDEWGEGEMLNLEFL